MGSETNRRTLTPLEKAKGAVRQAEAELSGVREAVALLAVNDERRAVEKLEAARAALDELA